MTIHVQRDHARRKSGLPVKGILEGTAAVYRSMTASIRIRRPWVGDYHAIDVHVAVSRRAIRIDARRAYRTR